MHVLILDNSEDNGVVTVMHIHFLYNYNIFPSEAVVGLERTIFTVQEDVGVVELCAIVYEPSGIDCSIAFPFDVYLSTWDDTAGEYALTCRVHYTRTF